MKVAWRIKAFINGEHFKETKPYPIHPRINAWTIQLIYLDRLIPVWERKLDQHIFRPLDYQSKFNGYQKVSFTAGFTLVVIGCTMIVLI